MITCEQCTRELLPDNPHIRSGKYNMCGCDYCEKPSYFRELETSLKEIIETKVIYRQPFVDKKVKDKEPF
ncbi:hypothetical protein LCGC14_2926850 [marine sediment metagenome]|uniref:Uncharacterized protein n=1 Tax=marine sediment metagenome TaxID=412755 RepID=A0A0F8XM53_9ZZZZ